MSKILDRLATFSGQALARYGLWVVRPERAHIEGAERIPRPAIGVGWHEGTLIGLALDQHRRAAPAYTAFVPPGWLGQAMRAWLRGYGSQEPAFLPKDGTGNAQAAFKRLAQALKSGSDVIIAVDGPHGPRLRVRPGAVWLARLTGRPLIPTAVAAWPAVRWPKWDRHLVPLPGAHFAMVYGEPLWVPRGSDLEHARKSLGDRLRAVNRRAWELVNNPQYSSNANRTQGDARA